MQMLYAAVAGRRVTKSVSSNPAAKLAITLPRVSDGMGSTVSDSV